MAETSRQQLKEKMRAAGRYLGCMKKQQQPLICTIKTKKQRIFSFQNVDIIKVMKMSKVEPTAAVNLMISARSKLKAKVLEAL
jgi:hypothetical protein